MKRTIYIYILIAACCAGCDFLDPDFPKSKIPAGLIFEDDLTAVSAVTGIYDEMSGELNFASGTTQSVTALAGLSSDDLTDISNYFPESAEFRDNIVKETNQYILGLWSSMYKVIYQSNAVLEGLDKSTGVSVTTKNQLVGEALFVRAFTHFYLVNLYGDVPLVTSTDYIKNGSIQRTSASIVYDQITQDLSNAVGLLSDTYTTTERVRPNKATAQALLARVYLYQQNWSAAEEYASLVIDNPLYDLPTDLNNVFLANSAEAIWQLMPKSADGIYGQTNESRFFSPDVVVDYNVLSNNVAKSFEAKDKRKEVWTGFLVNNEDTVYYPQKYKQYTPEAGMLEYSMVMRLAEQYLIRAEARANNEDLSGAVADVDTVRARAGLSLIGDTQPSIVKDDLLLIIANERKVELFSEWGHRWLDLKRTDKVASVLSPLKPAWTNDARLYPLPASEFIDNPALGDQNQGY